MLTPSGMLKLRFRLGTKFLAFESSGHLPQIATVVSTQFQSVSFRFSFISFRFQVEAVQATPSRGGGDCRGLPGTPGWGTWEMAVAGGF